MPDPVTAVVGAISIGGSLLSSSAKKSAAGQASQSQVDAAQLGIDETGRQFDVVQELLSPYVESGEVALSGQAALLGLAGDEAQASAITNIENSPQFTSLVQQGEQGILQNASATGGLRGGNTQAALAQFRPQVLSNLIQQRFGNLTTLSSLGQASAAGVGNAATAAGQANANLFAQQGAAQAGGFLAAGKADASFINDIAKTAGNFIGSDAFKGLF